MNSRLINLVGGLWTEHDCDVTFSGTLHYEQAHLKEI